jgi:hypothetical protein
MTAIEKLTSFPKYKHRVERVLFLLIHEGRREDFAEILRTPAEGIIVAIRADELLDSHRGGFSSALGLLEKSEQWTCLGCLRR